jgi:NitT/TauT family transport system permease protein
MYRFMREQKKSIIPFGDLLALSLIAFFIYGMIAMAKRSNIAFQPNVDIDLSIKALPMYALYSMFRALIAYGMSLIFTLVFGYWAAKKPLAEKIILPLLDIGQSIPVLGFLPGLVLGLIAIFPYTNIGLELACILMIFTGQVWNMCFSYYLSLKMVPHYFYELSQNLKLSSRQKLIYIELPYSASGLAWNSLMSMAGGWFFLTVCEAFTLGDKQFHLLGIGSYMSVAIEKGNMHAMSLGFITMIIIIIFMDFFIWRPIIAWTRKFRVDEQAEQVLDIPFINMLLKDSFIVLTMERLASFFYEFIDRHVKIKSITKPNRPSKIHKKWLNKKYWDYLAYLVIIIILIAVVLVLRNLLSHLDFHDAVRIFKSLGFTFFRVIFVLIASTLWTVPFGIWVGLSPRRTKFFQPIIQITASFPAPMLYPLVLLILNSVGINLGIGAAILMLMGVQWYLLFNVLAGATLISKELLDTFKLAQIPKRYLLKDLYLPSIFPYLVTGWVTAAGGAWNASIVAEYINYKNKLFTTTGIGALISETTASGNFELLAGALIALVITVVGLNHLVWKKIYIIAERRFSFDR